MAAASNSFGRKQIRLICVTQTEAPHSFTRNFTKTLNIGEGFFVMALKSFDKGEEEELTIWQA